MGVDEVGSIGAVIWGEGDGSFGVVGSEIVFFYDGMVET